MTWEGLNGPYSTIVADPPWDYGTDAKRWPSSNGNPGVWRGPIQHRSFAYSSMSLEEITELDVPSLSGRDARLFLWTTSAFLLDSSAVLSAWGFTYRQTLVWHKTQRPSPFGGSVAPNAAEFLLVATRGKPPVSERAESSVLALPRESTHSRKPQAFLDLIERVSPGPYVELFARAPRLGWDSWGHGYESSRGSWRDAEGALRGIGNDEPAEVTIRRLRGGAA